MEKFKKFPVFCILGIVLLSWTPVVIGGRILVFLPMSSKSMANIFEPLTVALASRGHEITVVSPVKFKIDPGNKNVSQHVWATPAELFTEFPNPFDIRRTSNLFYFPLPFQQIHCHRIYQNEEFQRIIREKFDVVVVNAALHDCFAGAWYKMGVPIIFVATLPMPTAITEHFGNYLPSSFVPICVLADISEQLNFIQRTKNFLYNMYFGLHVRNVRRYTQAIYREYLGEDVPSVPEIFEKQGSLILMNSHYAITNSRPLLPNVVEIGGIHCHDPKPLPKDLEEFASGAKDGFIVFSLGSIVQARTMPESVRLAFLRTFANLKQRVIWKWEKEEGMPDAPQNVKVVKWLPQQSLLAHPNVRLFITHGGLLSTEEATYHGVPVLGMPVFADQDANMRQAEVLGFGVKGEILDLTQEKLEPLVRKILDDPRYTQKAKNLSKIFRDQPHSSLEKAVFYTEYAVRHKGAYHLRSSAVNLNVLQYHSIDVVAFLFAVVFTILLFIYYILKLIIRFVVRGISKDSSKKKVDKLKKK